MTPRATLRSAAMLAGMLTGSHATACGPQLACIEVDPRHRVEFEQGSAVLTAEQAARLAAMLKHARHQPGQRLVSIRGFADRAGAEPQSWRKSDIALARARALAVAHFMHDVAFEHCVEILAMGSTPNGAAPTRVDAKGRRWNERALLVLSKRGKEERDARYKPERHCEGPRRPVRVGA